jgi:hypothetical protein
MGKQNRALIDCYHGGSGDADRVGGRVAHHSTQSVRAMKVTHGEYAGRQIGGGDFLAGLVQF